MNAKANRSVSASNPNTHTNSNPTDRGESDVLRQWLDSKPATVAETFAPATLSFKGSSLARIIAAFEGTAEVEAEGCSRADIIENDCDWLDSACTAAIRIIAAAQMGAEELGDNPTETFNGVAYVLTLVADVMQLKHDIHRAAFNLKPVTALR